MSKVVFLKLKGISKKEVRRTVHKSMELGNWKKFIKGKKIFVKINGISDQLVPGQCTSPWVIDSVLEKLKKSYPKSEIYIGDANLAAAKQLDRTAKLWGFYDLADKYNIKFINLSEQPLVKVNNFGGKVLKKIEVPKILLDVDTILNLPVVKTHCLTTITCCLKNHWGLLPRFRHQYHLVADQAIPDVNNYFRKTTFNVVDGTICMEGNAPRTGTPKLCNVIFAGSDRVALDYIVARFMGFDADKIKHIELAEKMRIGSRKSIKTVGDKFFINEFEAPKPHKQPIFFWEMKLRRVPVVKPILFDTPIFRCLCDIATFYNTTWWYKRFGKKHIKKILKTPYAAEFKPLLRKSNIKL
ncbi:MAG: DUF362 domain-containing protein [Candidatus Aenigmarchaeota archaeon]|nr:DUF362 domain-containing protein [Candidatus Aenigmarchaeota archaeon]